MGIFGNKYLIEHPERFETEEREIIALAESNPRGCRINAFGDKLWSATVSLIGCIDCETNELMELPRYLTWNYKDGGNKNAHGIKKHGMYRLKVLLSLPLDAGFGEIPAGRSLFVTRVLKKNVFEPRLEEVLEKYKKPVIIETAGGDKLELDRENDAFEGCVSWRGESMDIRLSVDDGKDTCDGALKAFDTIMADQTVWERKAKLFLAAEYTEGANDWQSGQEDYKLITVADFAKRITLCGINIDEDGEMEFWFDDDGMFFGHSLVAYGTVDGGFTEANMMG